VYFCKNSRVQSHIEKEGVEITFNVFKLRAAAVARKIITLQRNLFKVVDVDGGALSRGLMLLWCIVICVRVSGACSFKYISLRCRCVFCDCSGCCIVSSWTTAAQYDAKRFWRRDMTLCSWCYREPHSAHRTMHCTLRRLQECAFLLTLVYSRPTVCPQKLAPLNT